MFTFDYDYDFKAFLIVFVGCESGWTQDPSTSRFCYKFFSSKLNWNDARSHCQTLEGELASVTSNETNNFLTTLTQEQCWIGGYRDWHGWHWSDGSPWGYTNWASGQPDRPIDQHKLQLNYNGLGKWDNLGSRSKRPFICQKQSGMS